MGIAEDWSDIMGFFKGIAEGHDSICVRILAFFMAGVFEFIKDIFYYLRKPSNWLPTLAFILLPVQICFYIAATYGPWELRKTIGYVAADVRPPNYDMWRFLTGSLT
eukprot:772525_1